MIVLVMGMHRSGTSALAGLLHHNGIFMGEDQNFYPPPSQENPKGFYENYRFRSVNDYILSKHGYSTKSFSPMTPDTVNSDDMSKDIIRTLISHYDKKYENWGFKDPRTCLTYGVWKELLQEPYTKQTVKKILITRKFENIAKSMLARRNQGTRKQFIALCKEYYKSILKYEKEINMVIKFEDLINKTDWIASFLSAELGIEIKDTSFVDKKISKNSS